MAKRTRSAVKHARQSLKRRERNRKYKLALKSALKKIRATGSKAEAEKLLVEVQSTIDKSARRNIIHRNTARRLKSHLARDVGQLK